MPIRVLLADDHPVVRRGMVALLSSLDGVEVVGEADNGEDAVREAQVLRRTSWSWTCRCPAWTGWRRRDG
jgi:CheY-like chemotaxis protein